MTEMHTPKDVYTGYLEFFCKENVSFSICWLLCIFILNCGSIGLQDWVGFRGMVLPHHTLKVPSTILIHFPAPAPNLVTSVLWLESKGLFLSEFVPLFCFFRSHIWMRSSDAGFSFLADFAHGNPFHFHPCYNKRDLIFLILVLLGVTCGNNQ